MTVLQTEYLFLCMRPSIVASLVEYSHVLLWRDQPIASDSVRAMVSGCPSPHLLHCAGPGSATSGQSSLNQRHLQALRTTCLTAAPYVPLVTPSLWDTCALVLPAQEVSTSVSHHTSLAPMCKRLTLMQDKHKQSSWQCCQTLCPVWLHLLLCACCSRSTVRCE